MKTQQLNQKRIKSPIAAYIGYLFETFFKRPFGYIVAILYMVYLAVIFLIVPKALHFEPLTIWNIGGFNMPIINLFFIAAAAASIAVAIFRTSREDGMDLNLSAKPFTKGITVGVKTGVYLLIMLIMSAFSVIIVSLIKPTFGVYDILTNPTGIVISKYKGLMLSLFIGNLVNMLLFGGIAVFICMVGGQVATIIATIGVVIVMCIMSIIFPQVVKDADQILSDKYGVNMLSYSCPTLRQYNHPEEDSTAKKFATIPCLPGSQFDTYEYWEKANKESGRRNLNYIDFARQLSNVFNGFGMANERTDEASKMMMGLNSSYNYLVNKSSHVGSQDNIDAENYPVCFFHLAESEGLFIPEVKIIGGDMNLKSANWYIWTTLSQYDFNSCVVLSTNQGSQPVVSPEVAKDYDGTKSFRINDLIIEDPQEKDYAIEAYNILHELRNGGFETEPGWYPYQAIKQTWDQHHNVDYDHLSPKDKFTLVAKTAIYWIVYALEQQKKSIEKFSPGATFPYTSEIVESWLKQLPWYDPSQEFDQVCGCMIDDLLNHNAIVDHINSPTEQKYNTYAVIPYDSLEYVETFTNLYTYHVESFFSIHKIIAGWSIVAGVLFAGAIVVYKKTDFK